MLEILSELEAKRYLLRGNEVPASFLYASGKLTGVIADNGGFFKSLSYDAQSRLSTLWDGRQQVTFVYNNSGALTSRTVMDTASATYTFYSTNATRTIATPFNTTTDTGSASAGMNLTYSLTNPRLYVPAGTEYQVALPSTGNTTLTGMGSGSTYDALIIFNTNTTNMFFAPNSTYTAATYAGLILIASGIPFIRLTSSNLFASFSAENRVTLATTLTPPTFADNTALQGWMGSALVSPVTHRNTMLTNGFTETRQTSSTHSVQIGYNTSGVSSVGAFVSL